MKIYSMEIHPRSLPGFDIDGKSFERVEYSPKQITVKKITSGKYISSIRITVMDENGELIDFNNLPLRFEIEIK